MKPFIVCLILGCLALTSCRTDIVYSRFCPIPSEQWAIDSVARFDYAIADTASSYQMLIYVRHTERYPYQNMWLFVGDSLHKDTIEFYLADDRGRWLGDRHHGSIEMPVLLEENYHFPDTGSYTLTVQHGMRDSLLRGVMDVGLEVREITNKEVRIKN
jgi:gliding motility-associated lipoprotein GldH